MLRVQDMFMYNLGVLFCIGFFSRLDSVCVSVRKTEKAVSVCGPSSVLLQHPEKRNMALSGASLHTAYHSITSHTA